MAIIARGQITVHVSSDTYSVYQSVDKIGISCDYTGKVISTLTLNSVISVYSGENPIENFTIGAIFKPPGFSSITANQTTKTITYSVLGGDVTLNDSGTISIPVIINGQTFKISFGWYKIKAGAPGTPGKDSNLIDWVADWNSGKTVIDSQTIITPKIFAGTKNANNTITGIAIGKFSLSTINASGSVSTETVNGIYGFSSGKKTFVIDATGNAQLGYGNESIKYDVTTGKIQFGSAVSLAWIGATYINSSGIFTGSLSANTVNAININATQIVSGTINAARIDVNALKASLITAGNIEALTLNVVKGKIGGWTIDTSSIFLGGKNNTSGNYTAAAGAITIGNNGIRGFKWRLDANGAGALAGGNISWDSTGNVTFSTAVTLLWSSPINSIVTALGGASYPKLTKITATGIYTGSITASQITAGTISADRIATGSITATKLDAASIKASIINTDYINGLSCTFSKGKIGGWTIGANALTNTHITLDNGNKRIAVYGANSSATSGQRVQLYYNSDTDFGFYATDTSGNCVTRLGAANQIAGWNITTSQIYKNNVYLNSDGSIVNSTKWKLNNDGSGQIANGAISWNASGAVTFGTSVSLQWKNDIEASKSTNYGYRYYTKIIINGESGKYYPVVIKGGDQTFKRDILVRRSYSEQAPSDWDNNSTTHKGGLILLIRANFGGWGGIKYSWDIYELSEEYSRMFAGAAHCGNYCMFAIFLRGGGTTGAVYHIYSNQPLIEKPYSDSPVSTQAPQICYNSDLIFKSGTSQANAPAPRTLTAEVEKEIRTRRFIALAQNCNSTLTQHPLTYIGSTGIYTGTLTANQINAGTISADRIAAGSLNGNKITARTVTADRIVSSSITANEIATRTITAAQIKASAITAYEIAGSTITAAEIASRTITASKIATGTITANEIAARTITAGLIKASAITAYEIAGSTITAAEIASRTITASKIATSTITATEINVGSIQAAVVTATAINGLTCDFKKGKVGGFTLNDHALFSTNATAGHNVGIQKDGYMYNCNSSTSADYWALNTDGSALFGAGKIKFSADGSGYVANQNIKWDVNGNVTMTGTITATAGKIGNFNISGGKLVNSTTTASIEFSGLSGSSLYLNTTSSLISIRSDINKTGISIQTYSTGARGMYIVANAGSTYALETYGPMQMGQRSGERWCVPGVLYIGCKYSPGYNSYYRKVWGDGMTVSSFSHIGDGKYRVYHNLGHTDYTVTGILWSSTVYYGYFRLLERTSSYFVIQNIGSSGKADQAAFDFIVMGRNRW